MKKILSIMLTLLLAVSLVACSNNEAAGTLTDDNAAQIGTTNDEVLDETETEPTKTPDTENKEEKKPEKTPEVKPTKEPEQQQTQAPAPTQKPTQAPTQKPTETPVPAKNTLGKTLLSDFQAKAGSGMSAQAIAEALLNNKAIQFGGMAMPVEEGLLAGFDNAEITGFKSGAMFAPMIGSIPFVGYVFELENAGDASSFIANLKKNANLRWNICVEADEMVSGSAGNKVFFVMCPTSLEE